VEARAPVRPTSAGNLGGVRIRRELRDGDRDGMVELHQRIYPEGYGVAQSFVDDVATALDGVISRGWPDRPGDGVWIVEHDGELAGCLALSDEGGGIGRVRFFLLAPELRGRGLGRQLVDELMELTRMAGYRRLELATFDELTVAAGLYRSHGFRVVREERGPRWGRERFNYQHYALEL
jgi:ribosomal protein S18 acetylase RimI-like enzyme